MSWAEEIAVSRMLFRDSFRRAHPDWLRQLRDIEEWEWATANGPDKPEYCL